MELSKLRDWLSSRFLKESKPFTTKRDLNWGAIRKFGFIGLGLTIGILLLLPAPKVEISRKVGDRLARA
jgi:hypothetical protein